MRRAVAASIMIASAALAVSACQLISGLDDLHEDTTSAGGASSSSIASSTASSSSTGMMCTNPVMPVQPPGSCPSFMSAACSAENCAGTCCDAKTCQVECTGTECMLPTISCVMGGMPMPPDCTIDCKADGGGGGCGGKTIKCLPDGICHVICSGMDACVGTTIECSASAPCVVECIGGACSDGSMGAATVVKCGTGYCSVDCPVQGMGSKAPVVMTTGGTPCVEADFMGCDPSSSSSSVSSSASSSSGSGG